MTSTRTWTEEQRRGITTAGAGVLVSAAAGSGKTAVLAERCVHLVCDAEPACDVDELLVVTFTEAAAAEMKSRIESALRERVDSQTESARLARQIALVDRAQISTIHGFCAKLLRQHFHLLGLDPNFTILDADEALLLRSEIARELFADRYEAEDSAPFQKLIDAYGDGNDERLVRQIVATHELLQSVVDPERWREIAYARITEATDQPLEQSAMGRELIANVAKNLSGLSKRCDDALAGVRRIGGFGKYVDQLSELSAVARHWESVLESHGIDALAGEVNEFILPDLPRMPTAAPNRDAAKAMIDAVRGEMKKGSALDNLRFSETEWRDGLRAILPHAETFLSLVAEFGERYAAGKSKTRTVDFSDLERLALRVLRDERHEELVPSDAARLCHRRFRHVLVDEYQDINEVQDAILSLASRECIAGKGKTTSNLFSVGDVKQSIYRFRLAEPARFLDRQKKFKSKDAGGTVIDLHSNFRSRAPLLDAVNAVFERLMTEDTADIDYDDSHRLRAGLTYPTNNPEGFFHGAPIELHLLPAKLDLTADTSDESTGTTDDPSELDRTQREAELVARQVLELMGRGKTARRVVADKDSSGTLTYRPIEHRDIAILLRPRTRFKADTFAETLRQHGIPVHSDRGNGFFDAAEIRDMLALLSILDNQRQDVPLAAVLRSPLAGIANPEDAMARIRLAYPDEPEKTGTPRATETDSSSLAVSQSDSSDSVCETASDGENGSKKSTVLVRTEPIPFHEAVVRYAHEHNDELSARLNDFLSDLRRWREMAQRRPLAELIWMVYDESGLLAFCAGLQGGAQRQANLIHLHERARQFGTFQRQGLGRFLQFLDRLASETEIAQPSVASEADDAVRILSVHRSKGLEFPVVILPDLGKAINLQDAHGSILVDREAFLGLSVVDEARRIRYPSLAHTLVQNRIRRQTLAEELRVLYVAMTRAKEHLILVGTCAESSPQKWQSLYGSHAAPLPADVVLRGRTMLDWIGPAAASIGGSGKQLMQIIAHPPEEVAAWSGPERNWSTMSDEQMKLAQFVPLDPKPVRDASADALIERLTSAYEHRAFCSVPAAASVTSLSKGLSVADAPFSLDFGQLLRVPTCLDPNRIASATDVGSATHLVLEFLDFAKASSRSDVSALIVEMVAHERITQCVADLVDLDAVAWFLATPTGAMLRANAKTLRRELTIYMPAEAQAVSGALHAPLDRMMIRGRIDLLVVTPTELRIVDYKTDNVDEATIKDRAAFYQGQMEHYRRAIEKIADRKITGVDLVFLKPRVIWSLS